MSSLEQANFSADEALDRVESRAPLLDINNLQASLYQRLAPIRFVPDRIKALISETTKIHDSQAAPAIEELTDVNFGRQQLMTKLFLDSAAVIGNTILYENLNRSVETRKSGETHDQLLTSIAAGKHFQAGVQEYLEVFNDAPSTQLYEVLRTMLDDGRRLVYNDPDLPEWAQERHATILHSLLAETKVVRGLQVAGWPHAHHSSVDMDAHHQVDVVVPPINGHDQVVYLQVKHRKKRGSALSIDSRQRMVADIRVPMNPATHHPFDLRPQEVAKLSDFVTERAAA